MQNYGYNFGKILQNYWGLYMQMKYTVNPRISPPPGSNLFLIIFYGGLFEGGGLYEGGEAYRINVDIKKNY